ncbi:unnamed protein product [Rhizophagus irregularis]|nr:unnamed protein product [Rhizophagus irregularis]
MKRFDDDSGDETFERGCRNSIQPEASEFSDEGSQNETSASSSSSDSDSDESIDSNHQIHYESSNEESQNETSVSSPNSDTDYDESDAKLISPNSEDSESRRGGPIDHPNHDILREEMTRSEGISIIIRAQHSCERRASRKKQLSAWAVAIPIPGTFLP